MLLHLFGPFFSRSMCSTGLLSGCLRVTWTQGLARSISMCDDVCYLFSSGALNKASDGDDSDFGPTE